MNILDKNTMIRYIITNLETMETKELAEIMDDFNITITEIRKAVGL